MKVGVAGLGRMGAAIAARLIETGHEVAVWNRTAEKAKPLAEAGAKIARTPAELASASEVVITILTDAAAIEAMYNAPSGLLSGEVGGKLFIEMSTVRPETEIALAQKVRAQSAAFVECPVGGTTGPARQGKLLGLMGAEAADAQRAKPILDQLCRRLEHVGPVGGGALMKFAVNLPLMIYWQALGEALSLIKPLKLDPARVLDILADSSGGPNVLKMRGPAIAKMLQGEEAGPVTFNLDGGLKDLRSMLAEGQSKGLELPLVERTIACFAEASRNGFGERDGSSLPLYWLARKK